MNRERVLVIDDESYIREFVSQVLSEEYHVFLAASGEDGLVSAEQNKPSVVLLDILMPGMGGVETCRRLRENPATRDIRVVMLSALNESQQRVAAFDAGADDFVGKPFHPQELLARVDAKCRRLNERILPVASVESVLSCGDLRVELDLLKAFAGERELEISPVELRILIALLRSQPEMVSRRQLAEFVWSKGEQSDRALDPHMSSLRKKLGGSSAELKTVYGQGYSIIARRAPDLS